VRNIHINVKKKKKKIDDGFKNHSTLLRGLIFFLDGRGLMVRVRLILIPNPQSLSGRHSKNGCTLFRVCVCPWSFRQNITMKQDWNNTLAVKFG